MCELQVLSKTDINSCRKLAKVKACKRKVQSKRTTQEGRIQYIIVQLWNTIHCYTNTLVKVDYFNDCGENVNSTQLCSLCHRMWGWLWGVWISFRSESVTRPGGIEFAQQ